MTSISRPSLEKPSICNISVMAATVFWFGCIMMILVATRDLTANSAFIAFITSLMFMMSAHALVRGTFFRCRM